MAEPVCKLAIIAAMPGEVMPLVKGWRRSSAQIQGRTVHLFEKDGDDCSVIVACAGIGVASARIAAEAAWQHGRGAVTKFISAGLAGALDPRLKPGDIVIPAEVVDDADGLVLPTSSGSGKLVTAGVVASMSLKRLFAEKHHAQAVDMEAFAVGDVARIYGVPFSAVKAVSDELDFPMPPLGRFITGDGRFRKASFVFYSLLRPWTWGTLIQLGRNSGKASQALAVALQNAIKAAVGHYNSSKDVTRGTPAH